jgi:hypothetical protein
MKSHYFTNYNSIICGEFTAVVSPANNSYPIDYNPTPHRRH